jgi:hypothetical protein
MNEQSDFDLMVANSARDAGRYIKQLKFLEGEIKTLIGAIRTAPDLESLRVVANDTHLSQPESSNHRRILSTLAVKSCVVAKPDKSSPRTSHGR